MTEKMSRESGTGPRGTLRRPEVRRNPPKIKRHHCDGDRKITISFGLCIAAAWLAALLLLTGCASPGAQRYLGESAFDDALTGHRYLGPIEEQSIGRIDLQRLPPTTYRQVQGGESQGKQVLERWAVGATIRETRKLISDEFLIGLSLNRGVTGRVYDVELESLELESGEPVTPEMRRQAENLATSLVAEALIYEQAVLGQHLQVGQLFTWTLPENIGAALQNFYKGERVSGPTGDIDVSIEGASQYLGLTNTTYGEAAVFREYARAEFDIDGVQQVLVSAGWRLIERKTGALIERDMVVKLDHMAAQQTGSVYLQERLERSD